MNFTTDSQFADVNKLDYIHIYIYTYIYIYSQMWAASQFLLWYFNEVCIEII